MATGFTPIYRVFRDGSDITNVFNDRCTSIKVDYEEGDGGNSVANFVFDDRDWRIAYPELGEKLTLFLGYEEVGMANMGEFITSTVTFSGVPKSISLKATSADLNSPLKAPRTINFEKKTLGEVIGALAKIGGLKSLVNPSIADTKIPFLNMITSPRELMTNLQRAYPITISEANGQISVVERDKGETASGQKQPTLVLTQEHFGTWNVRHDDRSSFSKTQAQYKDEKTHAIKTVTENGLPNNQSDPPYQIGRMFQDENTARAAAQAQMKALNRGLIEAEFELAKGDPWIRSQHGIVVNGMRDGVNGTYFVDTVSHSYVKDQGIRSAMRCKASSDGEDLLELFKQATAEERALRFLAPKPGEVVGSVIGSAVLGGFSGLINEGLAQFNQSLIPRS